MHVYNLLPLKVVTLLVSTMKFGPFKDGASPLGSFRIKKITKEKSPSHVNLLYATTMLEFLQYITKKNSLHYEKVVIFLVSL